MSTMIAEVYDAFIAAGAPEDKAQAAAVALASDQLATKADIQRVEKALSADIQRVEKALSADIQRLDKELSVVKWTTGVIVAGVAALILKAFFI